MMIRQAMVAIGGHATRLVSAGYDVPVSKAFLEFGGYPLLRWSLASMYLAGIEKILLVGNEYLQLAEAKLLIEELPFKFKYVDYFEDPGLGVHGLPFHARHLLDDTCIFECGHSLMEPTHYRRLAARKGRRNIVMSAFEPHPMNPRQPVRISQGRVVEVGASARTGLEAAVAHPMVIDEQYINRLPSLGFNINRVLEYHIQEGTLSAVTSCMPPEFDIAEEFAATKELEAIYTDAVRARAGLLLAL